MRYFVSMFESSIGRLTLLSDGEALTAVDFPLWRGVYRTIPVGPFNEELPVFRAAKAWLAAYFSGEDPGDPPLLRPEGTEFRQMVWQELRQIPYGQLTTYGAIAKALEEKTGRRQSARAVGGAVGANPIAVMIPCHRCVGADGRLTGFGGGMAAKTALLTLEGHRDLRE